MKTVLLDSTHVMETPSFDVIVVGAGLFGSAAAKHLTLLRPDLRLALIGPGEPEDRADTSVRGRGK